MRIPLIANGDITTPQKAKFVLDYTGADGVMDRVAAQGRPWIFREIEHFLKTGTELPPPLVSEIRRCAATTSPTSTPSTARTPA